MCILKKQCDIVEMGNWDTVVVLPKEVGNWNEGAEIFKHLP